jgi:hypothetical protein
MTAMTSRQLKARHVETLPKSQLLRLVIGTAVAAALADSLLCISDMPSSPFSPTSPTVEAKAVPTGFSCRGRN